METTELRSLFEARVSKSSQCWEWVGTKYSNGYGVFRRYGIQYLAHRVSYILHNGDIPIGHEVHHTCKNRGCVNPDHLACITRKEHCLIEPRFTKESMKVRTVCKRGHLLENNTFVSRGANLCRSCHRIRALKAYHKRISKLNSPS